MASLPAPDDGTLLLAFQDGRAGAFEAIARRHYPTMLRVAEQRCGGGALAEDAVQTALVRAYRYLRKDRAITNLGAWLRRVVLNCANDLLGQIPGHSAPIDVAAAEAAPIEVLEREELRGLVAGAIDRLPDTYREPLHLCFLEGLEAREVAARLNDNLNSVKSRIARGRRELRRRLENVLKRAGYL